MNKKNQNSCSFPRRLGTIFYDSLLLAAVLFGVTFVLIATTDGEAIESGNILYNIFLLFVAYIYFCWHWTKGGQTLGMRSWHVYVIDDSGLRPDWKKASTRFLFACLSLSLLGMGFIWSLFDKDKLALHDHLSKTRLVVNKG